MLLYKRESESVSTRNLSCGSEGREFCLLKPTCGWSSSKDSRAILFQDKSRIQNITVSTEVSTIAASDRRDRLIGFGSPVSAIGSSHDQDQSSPRGRNEQQVF